MMTLTEAVLFASFGLLVATLFAGLMWWGVAFNGPKHGYRKPTARIYAILLANTIGLFVTFGGLTVVLSWGMFNTTDTLLMRVTSPSAPYCDSKGSCAIVPGHMYAYMVPEKAGR